MSLETGLSGGCFFVIYEAEESVRLRDDKVLKCFIWKYIRCIIAYIGAYGGE